MELNAINEQKYLALSNMNLVTSFLEIIFSMSCSLASFTESFAIASQ